MRKILITITMLLFTAMAVSYAGTYYQTPSEEASDAYGGFFSSSSSSSSRRDAGSQSGNIGLFRSTDPDPSSSRPGGRPLDGNAIGQQKPMPISDGLYVFIGFCIVFAIVKTFHGKRQQCNLY